METPVEAREGRSVSRTELSLEISRLVSRVVKGETVDTAASGKELAARFPEARMSAEMIAEAIVSAAGMVGMIRNGGATEIPEAAAAAADSAPLSDDDEIAVAIDAELSEFPANRAATGTSGGNGAAPAGGGQSADVAGEADKGIGAILARGAGAVRRAFFGG